MTFEIDINGRQRAVSVERVGPGPNRFRVTVDGSTNLVDAIRVESDTLSLIFPDDGFASHEVGFADGLVAGELIVHLHGGTLVASVNGRRSRRTSLASSGGEQRVIAPMPGRILRVLVAPGDEVAARQPLVVVEAMKMENELSCPRPGRIREVTVRTGQSVEAGRLLVVVE